jgi:RecB family exonuclease
VLHVREVARPEAIENLSALDEGTLLHAILEEFVRQRPPSSPTESWTARDRARMEAIVARRCRAAEASGLTGRPLLWRLARRRIERTAARFLAVDVGLRRAHDAAPSPETLEVPFGNGTANVSVTGPAGQTVHFRGRVDRIDVSADGQRAVVYDYKTGRADSYEDLEDDPVGGGELLQLPIYALAAQAITGASDIEAFYWFTRAETADDAPLGYRFDHDVEGRFEAVVDTIVTGIGAGCFPADPGARDFDYRVQRETFAHCFGCPYDRLCPLDRATTFARKEGDPALEPYWALRLDDRDER